MSIDADHMSDQTAKARIRDAAVQRFADGGFAATSVRAIADDAGVSAALVIHHFGSKAALRVACDEHVVSTIHASKLAAAAAGPELDVLAALRESVNSAVLLRYLSRTLVEESPRMAELVDELVANAEQAIAAGVAAGTMRPTDDPRGRAVVLTVWSLGALMLQEHLIRLLDADLGTDPDGVIAYSRPAVEILSNGVLVDDIHARFEAQLAQQEIR